MCYARSYKPVYKISKADIVDTINLNLGYWRIYIMDNPQPVDLKRDDNTMSMKKCKVIHKTVFFNDEEVLREAQRDFIQLWYYCREVPEEEKSIPEIRHIHVVRFLWWLD